MKDKGKKKVWGVWKGWGFFEGKSLYFYDHVPCIYETRKRAWESMGYPDKGKIKKVRVTVEEIL